MSVDTTNPSVQDSNLDDLGDVTVPAPNNEECLCWNGANWVNAKPVVEIDNLKPSVIPLPTRGQLLAYDDVINKWTAKSAPSNGKVLKSNNLLSDGIEFDNNNLDNIGINTITSKPLTISDSTDTHKVSFEPSAGLVDIVSTEFNYKFTCPNDNNLFMTLQNTGLGKSRIRMVEDSTGDELFFEITDIQGEIGTNGTNLILSNNGSALVELFQNGKLESRISNYESLINSDDTFITRKYYEDNIPTSNVMYPNSISPPQIISNQNNYSPTGLNNTNIVIISTDSNKEITGLDSSVFTSQNGVSITFFNNGTNDLKFKNQNANSTASNRFNFGADKTIQNSESITLIYLAGTINRWIAKCTI